MGSRDSMMRDYEEVDERIDLRHYWNVIRRRKWPILALAFTVSLVAALVALSMTPVYQASATVLIESQQSNVVSIEEVYELDTRSREYYETQVELLKSRPLAADVVETLALASEPEFSGEEQQGGFKLDWLNLDWRSWLPFDPASQAAGLQQNLDPDQQVIAAYSSRLSIEPVRNTQLVRVNFESQQPALAARVANAHAKAYVNSLLAARGDVVGSADEFMTERLGGLEEALQESERRLQEFREREQLVDVEGIRSQPTREINELNSRLVEVRGARSQAEIAYQQVANIDGASPDALQGIPAILDDEVVRRFQEAEGRARQKVAELADRYGPKHPKMIAAQAELAEATKNLRAQQASVATSIRNEYEAARAEEAALRRALGGAQQRYQDVGRKESELNALQREVETNRKLYDLFYTRLSETGATG
ncbi:MAG: GumC family protein, partial [Woeseia sp.]|nr:GumC family protein [Woeseia sp.]